MASPRPSASAEMARRRKGRAIWRATKTPITLRIIAVIPIESRDCHAPKARLCGLVIDRIEPGAVIHGFAQCPIAFLTGEVQEARVRNVGIG